ncbi:unnamed protein product [Medioppia subpectinata]|uniref:Protein kinase domain-containing protein n=1 Tax=Medioppia subpectinata TaxID=1979941 RepID=A0A7R9Q772_9ACAR|nr:unnamed protein product [Medioppia subpectinata]CAG2115255.1 unnamed protein product [Medioppia subpectinata]
MTMIMITNLRFTDLVQLSGHDDIAGLSGGKIRLKTMITNNIILCAYDLCDFGLSKSVKVLSDIYKQSTAKHSKDFKDNVNYMAPEVETTEYNHLIDVYSLALIGAKIFGFDSDDIRDGILDSDFYCYLQINDNRVMERLIGD